MSAPNAGLTAFAKASAVEKPGATAAAAATDDAAPAWEQIETGRYMPRRIRGSFPGRELG